MAIDRDALVARIQNLGDDTAATLMDATEIANEVNASGRRFHNLLLGMAPSILESTQLLTPDATSESNEAFNLPNDYYKTIAIYYVDDSNRLTSLYPIHHTERPRFVTGSTANKANVYYTSGATIVLLPVPKADTNSYFHYYLPTWTELTSGSTNVYSGTLPALDHFLDWIVYDVLIKMATKEDTDATRWKEARDEVEQQMHFSLQSREAVHPRRVTDARLQRWGPVVNQGDPDFWSDR